MGRKKEEQREWERLLKQDRLPPADQVDFDAMAEEAMKEVHERLKPASSVADILKKLHGEK